MRPLTELRSLTLKQIETRMQQLDALFLIPMENEGETLGLLLEYMELDNEWDQRTGGSGTGEPS